MAIELGAAGAKLALVGPRPREARKKRLVLAGSESAVFITDRNERGSGPRAGRGREAALRRGGHPD